MSKLQTVLYCERYRVKPVRANAQAVGLDVFYDGPSPLVVPVGHQRFVPLQLSAKFGAICGNAAVQSTPMLFFAIKTPSAYAKLGIEMTGPHFNVADTSATPAIGLQLHRCGLVPYNIFAYEAAHVLVTNYSVKEFVVQSRVGQLVCFNQFPAQLPLEPIGFSTIPSEHVLRCGSQQLLDITITTTASKDNRSYYWKVRLPPKMKLLDLSDGRQWAVFTIGLGQHIIGRDSRWLQLGILGARGLHLLGGIVDSDYTGHIRAFFVADIDGQNESEFTIYGDRTETIIPRLFLGPPTEQEGPKYQDKWAFVSSKSFTIPQDSIEEVGTCTPGGAAAAAGVGVVPVLRGARGFGELTEHVRTLVRPNDCNM
jgi:hypothetical protein